MWLARPENPTVTSLERASSAPGREASVAAGSSGHRWNPKTRSAATRSKTPLPQTRAAPPVVSSAGWNTTSTLRGRSRALTPEARPSTTSPTHVAAASAMAMCPS